MEEDIRPGFNRQNFDQTKRIENQQENISRTVMLKLVRIVAVPNKEKRNVKEAAEFFLKEVVKYSKAKDWCPLTWVIQTGVNADTINIKLTLQKENTNVLRGSKLPVPDIIVKNTYLLIRSLNNNELKKYKSTELALRLGWCYSDWSGTPIKKLSNELSKYEIPFRKGNWLFLKRQQERDWRYHELLRFCIPAQVVTSRVYPEPHKMKDPELIPHFMEFCYHFAIRRIQFLGPSKTKVPETINPKRSTI